MAMSGSMDAALKKYFGFGSLRPYQSDVIRECLRGRDCLVVMATGGGKSLCYQLPPLISQKTSVVVSPLLSLMQDQVMSLNQKGIKSEYLGSSQTNPLVSTAAQSGQYNVLYMTPEKAMSLPKRFWDNLLKAGICLVAVDEAHCISEWGPDFRIEFKKLHKLRHILPGIPFVALTATATSSVRDDIAGSLSLVDPFVYVGSFDRPNLYYGVKLLDGAGQFDKFLSEIMEIVAERVTAKESTIIYCSTIRDTEQIHDALTSNGIASSIYNGQMDGNSRQKSHRAFVTDETLVMVATIAFGMGIDKPDVRCVIHYGCPKSLECYYQESGRCGRDGRPSRCLLYYSRSDFSKGDFYCSATKSETHKEAIMRSFLAGQKYCSLITCRRQELLNYFGQASPSRCGNCDNCIENNSNQKDISEDALVLLNCIDECGGNWGLNLPISVLRGSKCKKVIENSYHLLSTYGTGRYHQADWWKSLAYILQAQGYIQDNLNGTFRCISLSPKGLDFLHGSIYRQEPLMVTLPPEMVESEDENSNFVDAMAIETSAPPLEISLSNVEMELYQMLVEVRKKLADDNGAAPYAICSDQVLRMLAKTRPSSADSLADVDGVNMSFIERFGLIITHSIEEMSYGLNLELDNFPMIEGYSEVEDPLFKSDDMPEPDEELVQAVLEVIQARDGVSFDEIASSGVNAYHHDLAAAIEHLEYSFEIYSKDGLYFTL